MNTIKKNQNNESLRLKDVPAMIFGAYLTVLPLALIAIGFFIVLFFLIDLWLAL